MNDVRDILNRYALVPNKLTLVNGVKIINTDKGRFVFKKNKNINLLNTYKYLKNRSFEYIPRKINNEEDYDVYEYIEDNNEPIEQKILDLIHVVTLLHMKTTFYKEVDIDDYKVIYESVNNEIDDVYKYYNNMMDIIDTKIYMAPSEYLIARNISKIYESLKYAKDGIDKWYELVKDKRKIRVVNIHNNLSVDHYLKSDKPYLISWEKSRIDIPIYDLLILYNNHYLDMEFSDVFYEYEKRYPLLEEERTLLFVLIAIPKRIVNKTSIYELCIEIRKVFDYLYKTEKLITEYRIEPTPH